MAEDTYYPGTSIGNTQRYAPILNPDTGKPRTPSNEVSMDLFITLMCAQMQNQDPMEPTDDKEFLAQMAQISSLQQMTALTSAFSATQAYGMIGKEVYAEVYEDGVPVAVQGIVSSVVVSNSIAYVEIGGKFVPVSAVKIVAPPGGNTMTEQMSNAANLIGKYVTASWKVGDTSYTEEGLVDRIVCHSDGIYAVVNGKEVNIAFINEISANAPDPGDDGDGG